MGRYGWIPSLPDNRDLRVTFAPAEVAALPPKNPRFASGLPPIWNQGQLGSCTAHGILRARNFAASKAGEQEEMLSRLQLYFDERSDEGTVTADAGAAIRTGIKSLVSRGAGLESLWPYDQSKFSVKPPQAVYDNALDHQALKYAAVAPQIGQIKSVLASGYPVVFGFTVFESMELPATTQSGLVPIPSAFERTVGGHCVVFNGFWDDTSQYLGFDNSWGTEWGNDGLGYMPYWYVASGMVSDCWVIYQVEGVLPEPKPTPPVVEDGINIGIGHLHIPARAGDYCSIGP